MSPVKSWNEQRREMVETQLRCRGIRDESVLAAMARIPREQFIPESDRHAAYQDEPIPIGHGQTISQPYITALMVESLELHGHEKVLEVGSGSGYHAAVLAQLAARVITVELIPALAAAAGENLARAGLDANVTVVAGDGSAGYAAEAPYDAISVAAGAPDIPHALIEQLADPGRLVIPVGEMTDQDLRVVTKKQGEMKWRIATACRFVPLRGGGGWR